MIKYSTTIQNNILNKISIKIDFKAYEHNFCMFFQVKWWNGKTVLFEN